MTHEYTTGGPVRRGDMVFVASDGKVYAAPLDGPTLPRILGWSKVDVRPGERIRMGEDVSPHARWEHA